MVGFFSRNRDDQDQEYLEEQPVMPPAPVPNPPSVDGVLPPGVSPTPAPVGNNLASQTTNPADQFHTKGASTSVHVAPAEEDSAGDYIMTAPPVEQHADEWSEPTQQSDPHSEHSVTPAYEEVPAEQQTQSAGNSPTENSDVNQEALPTEPNQPNEEVNDQPEQSDQPTNSTTETTENSGGNYTAPTESHVKISSAEDLDDLERIKQEALKQLTPLVGHLNQSPEEKFHTIMMLLQSTDDKSLIKPAYEVAQQIEDDETKAQALVDVVREIKYLEQKSE